MTIGESKTKFVKKANMFVTTTLIKMVKKKHKKTGGEYLSELFEQKWFSR